jgi:ABC-type sugar transport system ATPase subunit
MKQLSVAEMQIVEIARALVHSAEVIIMDEPTSALSKREVEALFELIRELKAQGVAVIYISHKLEEIFRIADRVTILRDGCCAATQGIRELNERRLIALMVGRELEPDFRKPSVPREEVALSVRGLGRTGKFHNVHFEVRQGEILGIAGLMGAGRTDLVSTLFGLAQPDAGEIRIRGRRVWLASPREALQNGIALVSENRKEYGLVLKMSVQHNLTLSSLQRCCQRFFIDRRRESQIVDEQIRAFSIKTPSRNQPSIYLSGGNQQKVVIAKMLLTDPSILILDEPTCGVDVGAKAELYAIITQLARNGKAILMVSSDLREILALSDRILVMREGDITAHLDPRQTSQEEVLQYALPQ